jgi:hypothetical protein
MSRLVHPIRATGPPHRESMPAVRSVRRLRRAACRHDSRSSLPHSPTRQRAAREFSAEEVEIFIRDILPRAGDSWVQIAPAAGWYGTDQIMFDDLAAFAAHIRRNDPVTRHTLFDLTAVVTTATTPDEAAALAKLMRQIGLKRFVMGS